MSNHRVLCCRSHSEHRCVRHPRCRSTRHCTDGVLLDIPPGQPSSPTPTRASSTGRRKTPIVYGSLAVAGRALARLIGFSFADVSPALCPAVPALSPEVVNAARQIEPDDDISRTMLLGLLL